jgi:hypothetical protein
MNSAPRFPDLSQLSTSLLFLRDGRGYRAINDEFLKEFGRRGARTCAMLSEPPR